MPAGIVASSLQARIETSARHVTGTATEIVSDVNRALCQTSDAARFATLTYVDLDLAAHSTTVINAGHLPAIVVAPGIEPRLLPSTGPALGILPDAHFGSHTLDLAGGAALVLYSDGVTEALDQHGEEFGETRLLDLVTSLAAATAAQICQAVLDARQEHGRHTAVSDDVTVLVVKRVAPLESL